jgi:pimeloyl-ACP methyl ester carboxylesterase
VEAGFDLWLHNSRGNRYSQDHSTIEIENCSKKQKKQYFDFSWSEMATYDQPALWNYVLQKTGQEQLYYIGHSQGTTQLFAGLSENHEFFSKRMKAFIAIAPCMSVYNMKSLFLR